MANIKVAVINSSDALTDDEVKAAVPALQTQVHRDFAPAWGVDADLSFVPKGGEPETGAWWLVAFVQRGLEIWLYSYEVCDACESDKLGYKIGETLVSDFVYPAWFETFRMKGSTQLDHTKRASEALQILAGGYMGVFDASYGN